VIVLRTTSPVLLPSCRVSGDWTTFPALPPSCRVSDDFTLLQICSHTVLQSCRWLEHFSSIAVIWQESGNWTMFCDFQLKGKCYHKFLSIRTTRISKLASTLTGGRQVVSHFYWLPLERMNVFFYINIFTWS
jgi:hypothetical protein